LYLLSARTAHRLVGYFEEQAVISYTQYLAEIDAGRVDNVPAPRIAMDYWRLPVGARLREVVVAVRADEAGHRDVNHGFADTLRPAGHLRRQPTG
jgi:ubiquinol oxidase